jgi:hypothetical protein
VAVAHFIDHWEFTLKDGKSRQLLDWLQHHEAELAASFPSGCSWLGLFGDVIAGESGPGWHMLYGLDTYGALDALASSGRDAHSEFGRLSRELLSFFDQSNAARGGRRLYRAAPDIFVIENA